MKTKTVTVDITYSVFEPGDLVRPSSSRSGLEGGIHEVVRFVPPLIPHELDGTVFIKDHHYGYSAEYIMLAKEENDDS